MKLRVIDDWKCQSSGECCRQPKLVAMTYAERRELEAHAEKANRRLQWRYNELPNMTNLVAGPCPFVTPENRCGVYEARPYNCRRFMCMRPDVTAEPLREGGPMGSLNLFTRIMESESARRQYEANQAAAQPWALSKGWKETQQ